MKKIYIVLLILSVVISISAVSAAENISSSDDVLEIDNVEEISTTEQNNNVSETLSDSSNGNLLKANESISKSSQKTQQVPSKATTKNIKSTYGTKVKYTLKLADKSGKSIAGMQVKFKIG